MKNNRELTLLMGSKHVMGLTIVCKVPTENGGEALIQPVDEIVANGNEVVNVLAEWANHAHYALIVCKDRGSYKGIITILASTNMLQSGMGLVGVAGADFMKDVGADLWPSKLLDLLLNL
jgi:hypothetical protein